jgi:hypothetical protein
MSYKDGYQKRYFVLDSFEVSLAAQGGGGVIGIILKRGFTLEGRYQGHVEGGSVGCRCCVGVWAGSVSLRPRPLKTQKYYKNIIKIKIL